MMVENAVCPNPRCGSDKILIVREGLAKCLMCGSYITVVKKGEGESDTHFYRLEVMPKPDEIKELATKQEVEVLNLSDGQWKFVNAVANKLTYAPDMRKHYRAVLIEVFSEKRTMQDAIDQICVEAGLKEEDLKKLMDQEFQKIPEAMREMGRKSLFT